ncbi:hypothetical protein LOF24_00005, partial [Sinorhizobium meliloti SM11]|uniref:hypothetical protein n=1 Tax=Rhizobium meliloti TaxID=382 RepID=UPI0023804C9B
MNHSRIGLDRDDNRQGKEWRQEDVLHPRCTKRPALDTPASFPRKKVSLLRIHRVEEVAIGFRLLQLVDEEL